MARSLGRWTLALDGSGALPSRELIGGKAWSIARMGLLGLPVPPAVVVTTQACAGCLDAAALPTDLVAELGTATAWLERETGRRFGGGPSPLLVSVRSGSAVSMPGMMDTVLNLGINAQTERLLASECEDADFAADTRRRFRELYAQIVLKAGPDAPVPEDTTAQLRGAVHAVFQSWNSRRARRYRQHHGIADTLGTAVTIQAMVFGNMDPRSGTGVLFSRNPLTGDPKPFGEYLARAQGEDVVSGKFSPRPLEAMRGSVPEALDELLGAARRLEELEGDVQDIEFTVERGRLFLLQARPAKRAPRAAVRIAVDLAHEGRITPEEALERVTPDQVRLLLSPRLSDGAATAATVLATGMAACPGVGWGVVVTDSDEADRRASDGEPIVLARP
ncbi:MAG: pyruvate, phosphate dikinase, partial [Acetobacteraceae bacterium]|nr:pyruvate, phosphate dikinase [Acetobacteraceae bacterium]